MFFFFKYLCDDLKQSVKNVQFYIYIEAIILISVLAAPSAIWLMFPEAYFRSPFLRAT